MGCLHHKVQWFACGWPWTAQWPCRQQPAAHPVPDVVQMCMMGIATATIVWIPHGYDISLHYLQQFPKVWS